MNTLKLTLTVLSFLFLAGCNQAQEAGSAKNKHATKIKKPMNTNYEVATLGGGCYWCMEAVFQRLDGVEKVESGFSGGKVKNPTYYDVGSGTTGHAEVIQITFNPAKVPFSEILKVFFTMHDPTTLNRQGNDIGTQYRSAIFYHNEAQKKASEEIIAELNKANAYPSPIVTEVTPFEAFYKAEDYHQNYYNNNKTQGYCAYVIQPKIEKFEKVFKDRLKK
jgi:methionine-S-sulfoxide reductase